MSKRFNNTSGPSQRQLRVAELVRRTLAEMLVSWTAESGDLPTVSITVGEVRMSSDLKKATVFVLPLGGINTNDVVAELNIDRRILRQLLGKQLHLKYTPALHFVSDDIFDQMDNTRRLLDMDTVKRDLSDVGKFQKP